jgi:hypothetical protein
MSNEVISDLAVQRPGHPGQYGFLLCPEYFQSEKQAA